MISKTVKINKKGELSFITFPKLSSCGAVRHAFTTRNGGVSKGFLSSMNMSFGRGDEIEAVKENYRRICEAVGISTSELVLSCQTHTDNVIGVTKEDCTTGFDKPSFSDVDGLITDCEGVALVTQYADCTPLLFCDPVRRVVANSHSGWRGTAKMIGAVTVEKMVKDYGCKRENIIAAIGPCICKNCYEVDDPVFEQFSDMPIDLGGVFTPVTENHYLLDLRLANKKILMLAGIREDNIDIADLCTCCESQELFSHRAMGNNRGNLAAIIALK